jgi:hypothetical protein
VVEVSMGEDHRVDLCGREPELLPVAPPQLPRPLEQPAVQQQPLPAAIDQEFAAGYRACTAKKRQHRPRFMVRHAGILS